MPVPAQCFFCFFLLETTDFVKKSLNLGITARHTTNREIQMLFQRGEIIFIFGCANIVHIVQNFNSWNYYYLTYVCIFSYITYFLMLYIGPLRGKSNLILTMEEPFQPLIRNFVCVTWRDFTNFFFQITSIIVVFM